MHEASIALAIVDEITERAPQDGGRVSAVRLRIGALAAVDTAALAFAWELATNGTPAAGSQLKIEHVPLAIFCGSCGGERTVSHGALPVCPDCANPSSTITHGRELQVTALEVVYDAPTRGSAAEHSAQEQHAGA